MRRGGNENAKCDGDAMCGRYGGPKELEVYADYLPVHGPFDDVKLQLEYSIGQMAPVFARNREGEVVIQTMRMGLIPHSWNFAVKDWRYSTHNARLETIVTNGSFARSWARGRRCIVPAQWVAERLGVVDVPGGKLQADFHDSQGHALGLAGLWDCAETRDGRLLSFALITREPGLRMAQVHPREVCVLKPEEWARYLTGGQAVDLSAPWPDDAWTLYLPNASRKRIELASSDLFTPQSVA